MNKFKVKISPTYYSDDYFVLKYTTNGIFWRTLRHYEFDIMVERAYMVKKSWHYTDAKYVISEFKTLDDIKKYEEKELKQVKIENEARDKKNKENKINKRKIYKKYG
jgi:hypothetical protein